MHPISLSLSSCCAFIAHQLNILPYISIRSIKQTKILGEQYQTYTTNNLHYNNIHSNQFGRIYKERKVSSSSTIMEAHPVSQYITDTDGKWRLCAGVAILNSNNEILIGERIGITPCSWQAPQECPRLYCVFYSVNSCVQYKVSTTSLLCLTLVCFY